MSPERWRKIKELFQATVELEPHDRAAFVERACDGDEELRHEVDALVLAHEETVNLIDQPVFQIAATLVEQSGRAAMAGQRLGPYRITGEIGQGGMGEVYLAEDTRLGRRVAVKILP